MKDTNPFNLKVLEDQPKEYLDTDEFIKYLNNKKIIIRKDNLPRFADTHGIKMARKKREGSGGSVPTIYKIPTKAKLDEIKKTMSLNNNNALGKENLKNKDRDGCLLNKPFTKREEKNSQKKSKIISRSCVT